jgi:branched-chain amino acid transport system permease protein
MRSTLVSPRSIAAISMMLVFALIPLYASWISQPYYLTLMTRVMIFAIAAAGLNLILGFGPLVSFGHALYIGIGAYAVGIPVAHGVTSGFPHFAIAIVASGACALVVGAVCLRATGVAFIMITLAFAQMFYYIAVGARAYGGDDGLSILSRSNFAGIDLGKGIVLYYVAYVVLAALLGLMALMVQGRFGMVLRACKSNHRRMRALGFPTFRYLLVAYVISAVICAIAGFLLANLTGYASPSYMQWTVSGDLIVMVVLGGLGTVFGPVVGATAFLIFEEILPALKVGVPVLDSLLAVHWLALLGLFIILVTLGLKRGLYGALPARRRP